MREMSEKELLLLSNYLYMDSSVKQGTITELLTFYKNENGDFDINRVQNAGIGGGMSAEDAVELFTEMERSSDSFKNLEVVRVIDEGGIRGVCFADSGGRNATVVFRGTGGEYHAWADNVHGEYLKDTDMQRLAADFVRNQCGVYENITVSGHSKGGNLAQYVTVVCPEKVDRCISYDGQGFGTRFIEENGEEIREAALKITSISAYNDFVNILLRPIAGRRIFVENEGGGVNAHSSYWLLTSARFDENGNFSNITRQSASIQVLERATAFLVERMEKLPGRGDAVISNLLAAIVAAVMSGDQSEEYEQSQISQAAAFLSYYVSAAPYLFGNFTQEPIKLFSQSTYVSISSIKNASIILRESSERIRSAAVRIEEIKGRRGYSLTVNFYADAVMANIIDRLYKNQKNNVVMSLTLEEMIALYEQKEIRLTESMYV
ncbi:MAG: DUF2974 domain-containing protein [Lachnospiraceae bacterium]